MTPKFSIIVPVFNRPDEVRELIESLASQTFRDFELIIVEDGSTLPCGNVVANAPAGLEVRYFMKENSGPGLTRNYGAEKASGKYLIFLDSDVTVPENYLQNIEDELTKDPCVAFGGPDCAHPSFTRVQQAISWSMTSFLTTGGIRGGKKQLEKFHPRSFNMGINRDVFNSLGGFSDMRFGEDIELSIRIMKEGFACRLFPEAWVWHKRRTTLGKFFRQVFNSGAARVNLGRRHPGSIKFVHTIPAIFTGVAALCIILAHFAWLPMGGFFSILLNFTMWNFYLFVDIYTVLLLIFGIRDTKNFVSGCVCVAAAYTQIVGYGAGFLMAVWDRMIMGHQGDYYGFKKNFYK